MVFRVLIVHLVVPLAGFFGYDGEASFFWILVTFVIILMIKAFLLSVLGIAFLIFAMVGISVII